LWSGEANFEGLRDFNLRAIFEQARAYHGPLLIVMTVCGLVYAALAYRIREVLKDQGVTFPHPSGPLVQHPTARWVLPFWGTSAAPFTGQWPLAHTLRKAHQQWLRLPENPDQQLSR
jgi:hypothetical protein